MTRPIALLATLGLLQVVQGAAPPPARAAGDDDAPAAFRLSVDLDVPIVLVGGALASSYFLMSETAPPPCTPRCDPSRVNALDRPAAGLYSTRWQVVGDVATASTLVIVPLALFAGERAGHALEDVLVVAEAALITSAVQVPVSYAVARPRPRVYGDSAPLDERNDANAGRSFFSGHVANCVAATVATSRALRRLHRPALAWAALGVGLAGSALVGVGRVGAGSHFPSDVLVGAAVGTGVGIAIPALHETAVRVAPAASAGSAGLTLTGTY
jgi:membrane-associated phospholipid phosphatase